MMFLLVYAICALLTFFALINIDSDKKMSFASLILVSVTWPVWLVYWFVKNYDEDRL